MTPWPRRARSRISRTSPRPASPPSSCCSRSPRSTPRAATWPKPAACSTDSRSSTRRPALECRPFLCGIHANIKLAFAEACKATFALGDSKALGELLDTSEALPVGESTPYIRAHAARFRARADVAGGPARGTEPSFEPAADAFRKSGLPFGLAVTQLEHAEWLVADGRTGEAEALLAESRETFERLAARPWLERLGRAAVVEREPERDSIPQIA